ncbi:hypothetical protein [Mycoplasma leonicaptivi]|uniref:hypothetical protein n=1 Tax=Mycoplasma leonicaptivi TaxID=36742 RepID=UPI0004892030|nr:hypothetical protein [Mycoplasma leonicaptivi]
MRQSKNKEAYKKIRLHIDDTMSTRIDQVHQPIGGTTCGDECFANANANYVLWSKQQNEKQKNKEVVLENLQDLGSCSTGYNKNCHLGKKCPYYQAPADEDQGPKPSRKAKKNQRQRHLRNTQNVYVEQPQPEVIVKEIVAAPEVTKKALEEEVEEPVFISVENNEVVKAQIVHFDEEVKQEPVIQVQYDEEDMEEEWKPINEETEEIHMVQKTSPQPEEIIIEEVKQEQILQNKPIIEEIPVIVEEEKVPVKRYTLENESLLYREYAQFLKSKQ